MTEFNLLILNRCIYGSQYISLMLIEGLIIKQGWKRIHLPKLSHCLDYDNGRFSEFIVHLSVICSAVIIYKNC